MAEVVLAAKLQERDLDAKAVVDSAGIGNWHLGEDMDPRAAAALARRGYAVPRHRARQFKGAWLDTIDVVVAMDRSHLSSLRSIRAARRPPFSSGEVHLFGSFQPQRGILGTDGASAHAGDPDIPDPYYGPDSSFDSCLEMIEKGCEALATEIQELLGPSGTSAGEQTP